MDERDNLLTDEGRRFVGFLERLAAIFGECHYQRGVVDALRCMFRTRRTWFRAMPEDVLERSAVRVLQAQLITWLRRWSVAVPPLREVAAITEFLQLLGG